MRVDLIREARGEVADLREHVAGDRADVRHRHVQPLRPLALVSLRGEAGQRRQFVRRVLANVLVGRAPPLAKDRRGSVGPGLRDLVVPPLIAEHRLQRRLGDVDVFVALLGRMRREVGHLVPNGDEPGDRRAPDPGELLQIQPVPRLHSLERRLDVRQSLFMGQGCHRSVLRLLGEFLQLQQPLALEP